MATIEERAYVIYPNLDFFNNETKRAFAEARQKLISFATEQYRIARQEERERCIAIMTQFLEREYAYNGSCAVVNQELIDALREQIEGCE